MSAEDTDLERRVLAHEQILQALIAHVAVADPQFLDSLRATFSHPVRIDTAASRFTDTAAYAALFVREVVRLGESDNALPAGSLVSRWDDLWPTEGEDNLLNENVPVRFDVRLQGDLWEVKRDGRLVGGYVSRTGALEAAQAAVQDILRTGGSAQVIATGTGEAE